MNRVEIIVVINNIAPVVRRAINPIPGGGVPYLDDFTQPTNLGRYAVNTNSPEIAQNVEKFPQLATTGISATGMPIVVDPNDPSVSIPVPPYVPIQSIPDQFTGRYSLDLFPDDTQIPTTYQLSDITDISTVNSTYTKTISLPGSKRNQEAFGFISDLSADSTFNPNKRCRVYVLSDTIPVLEGWIQLTKIIRNTNNNIDRIEATIYADNANLWTEIGEATLDQIDLSEINHNRDQPTIVNSWSGTPDRLGYYYPLIDYGGWGTSNHLEYGANGQTFMASGDWTLSDIGGRTSSTTKGFITPEMMYPAVYVKTIWDKIFQNAGYQYKSTFLNSNLFKTLLIPFNRSVLKRASSWLINKKFTMGLGVVQLGYSATYSAYGTSSNGYYLTSTNNYSFPTFFGNMEGIGNLYKSGFGGYGPNNYTSAGVRVRFADTGELYPIQQSFTSDPGHVWSRESVSYSPNNSATANDGWTGRMKIRFGVYYKMVEFGDSMYSPGGYSQISVRRTRDINGNTFSIYSDPNNFRGTGIPATNDGYPGYAAWTDTTGLIPDVNGDLNPIQFVFTTPAAPVSTGNQNVYGNGQFVATPNGMTGRCYEGEFYTAWLDGSNVNQYPTWPGEQFYLEYKGGTNTQYTFLGGTLSYIDPKTAIWIEFMPDLGPGETVDMNATLPVSVKQKDWMMSVIKMFNLVIEPDKEVPNMLNIEPRDDYYSKGATLDWSDKLDRNQDMEIKILGDVQNKTTVFSMKDDKDYYNEDYKSRNQTSYGSFKFELDNDFIEGEKKVEVMFSPTPITNVVGSRGFVIPKIVKASNGVFTKTDSNMRILRKTPSGTVSNPYSEVWRLGTTSSTAATYSYYPYVGHFDNPYTPTDDLNFGQTVDLYYFNQLQATNQNLYTKYYYKQMNEYASKDSRLITAMFNLNPKDIYDFRFNSRIIIDNQYYKAVKIDGYDPTQRSSCKVILTKTLDITSPPSKAVGLLDWRRNTGLITAMGANNNTIMSHGSGVLGAGNIIPLDSNGSLVVGNGNLLAGNNPLSIVNGNNNIIGLGAEGVSVFGSANVIAPSSTGTVFGNDNTISDQAVSTIFGSSNIVSASSSSYIVGDTNVIAEGILSASVIGSNNDVRSESSTVFGDNNFVPSTTINAKIFGNYITFSSGISNTTAIGRGINAVLSDTVYISGAEISSGTGSAFGLYNTLLTDGDPGNQAITGTVSIVRGSYSNASLQIAPIFTKLDTGGSDETTYIQRSFAVGGTAFTVRTGSYFGGSLKSNNLIELDVQAMITSGLGNGEMYWSKTTRIMNNGGILIGTEDQVVKTDLSSGRSITITFVKSVGNWFDIVITIAGSASDYDLLIKAKRTTLGPVI